MCNLEEFRKEARKFVRTLIPARGCATVVGLYGNLGAGKTTFAQEVGRALGVTGHMQSPTFLIIKTYNLPLTTYDKKFKRLIHIDVYRLTKGEELRKLHFEELLRDPGNLVLIEWADKVADVLPRDYIKISFEFFDEDTRKITIQK